MAKLSRVTTPQLSLADFEYGVASVAEEVDHLYELLSRTKGQKDRQLIVARLHALVDLYDRSTGRKVYNKV